MAIIFSALLLAPHARAGDEPAPQEDDAEESAAADDTTDAPGEGDDASEDSTGDDSDDEVEEVVVTGTRTQRRLGETPIAVEVISREDIERSGASDLSQVLDTHPGVDVVRDQFGASIRLRGLDANQVLVLVDGQRLVGRTGGAQNIGRIPVDDIERIEIVKGPSSALYGSDALGGVVQIVTRSSKRPSATLDLRGGTMPSTDLTATATAGASKLASRWSVGFHSSPMFDRDPSDPATTLSGRDEWLFGGRVDLTPDPDFSLPISGQYTLTGLRGVDQSGLAVLDRRNATQDARLMLHPSLTGAHSRTSLQFGLSAFRDQFVYDQRDGSDLDQFQETRELLLQLSPQRDQVAGSHALSLGADLFPSRISSDRLEDGGGSRITGAVFVQDEWRIAAEPKLAAVPGFRLDVDHRSGQDRAFVSPNPRLALRFDPHEHLTLRASAGTGFRAPTFRELYLRFDNVGVGYTVTGNPELVPETSRTVDAAAEWDPAEALGLSVAGWWTELDDLINFVVASSDGPTTVYTYENVARARTRGTEATVSAKPAPSLQASASYTFTDALDLSRARPRPLSGRQKHRATLDLLGRIESVGTELSTRAAYIGPSVIYDDDTVVVAGSQTAQGTPVPGYLLLDVRAEQRIVRDLHLYAGANNLLDAGDTRLLLLPPRLVYAGLHARMAPRRRPEGR